MAFDPTRAGAARLGADAALADVGADVAVGRMGNGVGMRVGVGGAGVGDGRERVGDETTGVDVAGTGVGVDAVVVDELDDGGEAASDVTVATRVVELGADVVAGDDAAIGSGDSNAATVATIGVDAI
jgi:hypothetical protein